MIAWCRVNGHVLFPFLNTNQPMWQEGIVNYRQFLRLVRNNPDISWVDQHIGPPQLREWSWNYQPQRRRYIEEVMKFVDFRDFAKLDLAAPVSSKKDIILNGHANPSREEV